MRVLIVYASAHGSTGEVARVIAGMWRTRGIDNVVADVGSAPSLEGYDAYVLGSAVHNGMWLPGMAHFVGRSLRPLSGRPVYLWLNCLRVLEPNGHAYVTDYYLPQMLDGSLAFRKIGVFPGSIDRAMISQNELWLLTFRYDGDKPPSKMAGDFRDWPRIRAWADEVAADLEAISPTH